MGLQTERLISGGGGVVFRNEPTFSPVQRFYPAEVRGAYIRGRAYNRMYFLGLQLDGPIIGILRHITCPEGTSVRSK